MILQSTSPTTLPASFKKMFPEVKQIILITFMGRKIQLSEECISLPIDALHDFLTDIGE